MQNGHFNMTTFTTEDLDSMKTEWFPVDIKPTREGKYEVETASWPWPFFVEWDNEFGWFVDKGVEIIRWRGLKEQFWGDK